MYENHTVDLTDSDSLVESFAIMLRDETVTESQVREFVALSGASEEVVRIVMEKINIRVEAMKLSVHSMMAAASC